MRFLTLSILFLVALFIAASAVFAMRAAPPGAPAKADKEALADMIKQSRKPASAESGAASAAPPSVKYSKSAYDITPLPKPRIDELAKKLTPDEARVILDQGTERAFCGNLYDNHKSGVYVCRLCGLPLFSSDHKFDSGTGWPSFFTPYDTAHVAYKPDASLAMERVEILCTRCTAHLGHVFNDGPQPTNLRYCVNSASLEFVEKAADGTIPFPAASQPIKTQTAYFAAGCFWGVEDRFQQLPGVVEAISGYMGGSTKNPTYPDVCTHTTGHAETVKVIFDPARITYRHLLEKFFKFHDATQLNRQGPDIGDNYRSAIFAADNAQLDAAKSYIAELEKSDKFKGRTIATQVVGPAAAGPFYEAEEYHQDYHAKHGGHCALPPE